MSHSHSSSPSSYPVTLSCSTSFLLLLLSSCLHAAILTSQDSSPASLSSASASSESANQRSARSVLSPRTERGAESEGEREGVSEGRSGSGCKADFVEEFFRILSGPVGKEAEAVVAAVLKLLSENDRVNWRDLISRSASLSSSSTSSSASKADGDEDDDDDDDNDGEIVVRQEASSAVLPYVNQHPFRLRGSRSHSIIPGYGLSINSKRSSPKFNPTGWKRKKRSVPDIQTSDSLAYLQHVLRSIAMRHRASQASLLTLPEAAWTNRKRNTAGRVVLRRRYPQGLKRKPLEFNPTGW